MERGRGRVYQRRAEPAKVVKVEILEGERKACRVTVPDHQLSLAIGNKGQNARLCARLTGYNIDIRPESGYYGEDEEDEKAGAGIRPCRRTEEVERSDPACNRKKIPLRRCTGCNEQNRKKSWCVWCAAPGRSEPGS